MSDLEEQLDDLEVEFEAAMVTATPAQLFELGRSLGITNFVAEMRKAEKMRALREWVHKSWGEDTAQNVQYLRQLHNTMASFKDEHAIDEDLASVESLARQRLQDERDRRQYGQPPPSSFASGQEHARGEEAAGREMFTLIRALADANIAQRRQLKIVGIIGDVKDNKAINYINLMSQVADAKASKFSDDEIARAIKKAIAASSHLRTYFDAAEKIDLSKMLGMLRDFYQEKSASELFAELGQLCQSAQEKSTDFLLRAMQMREKTTAAAVAEGDLYNSKLVNSTFVRTVKTGLREESIRAQLTPYLSLAKPVDDSVLLREVNVAELENEEKTKKQKRDKRVTIAQATTSAPNFDEALKPILEGMTALQQRLDEMQSKGATAAYNSQRESSQNSSNNGERRPANRRGGQVNDWRCRNCRRDDLRNCWHCYNCGATGHRAVECTASKN